MIISFAPAGFTASLLAASASIFGKRPHRTIEENHARDGLRIAAGRAAPATSNPAFSLSGLGARPRCVLSERNALGHRILNAELAEICALDGQIQIGTPSAKTARHHPKSPG